MAAHILTAIQQTLENGDKESFRHGLGFAPFGDNISIEQYEYLLQWTYDRRDSISHIISDLKREWNQLGKPATSEEWMKAKYP